MISNASGRKLRPSSRPLSRSRTPGLSFSASQAWLNQTTSTLPDSSATVASTIRRLRRRVGRRRELRTSTRSVAGSPGAIAETVLISERSIQSCG